MSSRTVLGGAINILQIALVRSDTSYSVFKHAIARSSALKSRLPCNARNEFVITRISGPNHGELHNGNVVSCTIHMKIIILSLHKAELNTAPHRMALLVNMCLDLIRWCCCSISFLAWESAIAWWNQTIRCNTMLLPRLSITYRKHTRIPRMPVTPHSQNTLLQPGVRDPAGSVVTMRTFTQMRSWISHVPEA